MAQLKISNLPANMTQASLAQVFSPLEGVTSVRLFRDANNMVTGFVDFIGQRTADLVKSVYHGWVGFGQPLIVDYSYDMPADTTNKRARDEYDLQASGPLAKQARGLDSMGLGSYGQSNGTMQGLSQNGLQQAGPVSGYTSSGTGLGLPSYQPSSSSLSNSTYNTVFSQQMPTPSPAQQAMSGYASGPLSGSGLLQNGVQHMMQSQVSVSQLTPGAPTPAPVVQPAPIGPPPQIPNGMVMVSAQQAAMIGAAAAAAAAPPPVPPPVPPPNPMVMVPQHLVAQANLGMQGATPPMQMQALVPPPRPPPMVPGPRPPMAPPPSLIPPNAVNTVYIELLPNDVSKRELAHVFRRLDGYKNTRIVCKDSQKRAGEKITMAFVEFQNVAQAANAINLLQGYVFDLEDETAFALKLSYARPHSKPTLLQQSNAGKATAKAGGK